MPAEWPADRNILSRPHHDNLVRRLHPHLEQWLHEHRLPVEMMRTIETLHIPLAARLEKEIEDHGCRVLGIAGGQGTGKSTLSGLLVEILEKGFGRRAVTFSIDDIYLTRDERRQLARDVHPLLATRGVPGTHDPLLGLYLIRQLREATEGSIVPLPRFDKAADDRLPPDRWQVVTEPVDLVIFEGWCVGAMPQPDTELEEPLNNLERTEDADGTWRRYVNDELAGPYIDLFVEIDLLLMLQAPGMEQIIRWRQKQEQGLRDKAGEGSPGVMDDTQIRRFVSHYERVTRAMLEEMPQRADIVFALDSNQQVASISFNDA